MTPPNPHQEPDWDGIARPAGLSCSGPLDAISSGLQALCWDDYVRSVRARLLGGAGRRWWHWRCLARVVPVRFAGAL